MDKLNDYVIQIQDEAGRWNPEDFRHDDEASALEEVDRLKKSYPDVAIRVVAV